MAASAGSPRATIYDPGASIQTLNNQIVVLPDGTLIDFFSRLGPGNLVALQLVRSPDKGVTWSAPDHDLSRADARDGDPQTGASCATARRWVRLRWGRTASLP